MTMRSMLFIPGDSEKKLAKADDSKADAIIIDLEDSVTASRKAAARDMAREFLKARPQSNRSSKLYVRINPLDTDAALQDLTAVSPGVPDGIMLPKCSGPDDVGTVSRHLDVMGAQTTRIVAIAGETAKGVLALGSYADAMKRIPRLAGLCWGPWDLAADIGAAGNADANNLDFTSRMAMSMTLLAAKAAGLQAIDTAYTDYKDEAGLLKLCRAIRREGWTGKIAIHPAQVPVIHDAFRPDAAEIAHAKRVIEAFAAVKDGVVSMDGVMLDLPHLKQAQCILDAAAR